MKDVENHRLKRNILSVYTILAQTVIVTVVVRLFVCARLFSNLNFCSKIINSKTT